MLKMRNLMQSQNGSAMIVALLVFMVLTLLGTTILSVAAMENKVAMADNRMELASQAADAGVEVARNVAMNYIGAGESIPAIDDIIMDNGCRVDIDIDDSDVLDTGIVTITSRAYVENTAGDTLTTRAAVADMYVNSLPDYPLRSSTMKITGKYYAMLSDAKIKFSKLDWQPQAFEPRAEGVNYTHRDGNRKWKVSFDSDPKKPTEYALNGKSLDAFEGNFNSKHPLFDAENQSWEGNPDYVWWVDYAYIQNLITTKYYERRHWWNSWDLKSTTTSEGDPLHDLDNSKINLAPFYAPWGYVSVLSQGGGAGDIAIKDGWREKYQNLSGPEKVNCLMMTSRIREF